MTEDRDARLAALAARRPRPAGTSATRSTTQPDDAPSPTEPAPRRAKKPGRRHAAAGGRVIAVGLSMSAAIVFAALMGRIPQPAAATTAASAPIVVHVVLPTGQTAGNVDPTAAAAAAAGSTTTTVAPTAPTATTRQTASTVAPAAPVVRAAPATAKATTKSRAS